MTQEKPKKNFVKKVSGFHVGLFKKAAGADRLKENANTLFDTFRNDILNKKDVVYDEYGNEIKEETVKNFEEMMQKYNIINFAQLEDLYKRYYTTFYAGLVFLVFLAGLATYYLSLSSDSENYNPILSLGLVFALGSVVTATIRDASVSCYRISKLSFATIREWKKEGSLFPKRIVNIATEQERREYQLYVEALKERETLKREEYGTLKYLRLKLNGVKFNLEPSAIEEIKAKAKKEFENKK